MHHRIQQLVQNRNAEGTLPDDNQDEIDVVPENVVDSAGNQVNETENDIYK